MQRNARSDKCETGGPTDVQEAVAVESFRLLADPTRVRFQWA